ncbi:MAG: hypothetical protein IJ341_02355 [Bacteroidales bacterium]|nr:hypothetical protein [Bacteroidales bacterium]
MNKNSILHPTVCNLCGGEVEFISNSLIYGKPYGSGYCYYCTSCGAYVGTHKPRPKDALGILANNEMREMKKKCHAIFDTMWTSHKERSKQYAWLAKRLGIKVQDCHFGHFDLETLNLAYTILCEAKAET